MIDIEGCLLFASDDVIGTYVTSVTSQFYEVFKTRSKVRKKHCALIDNKRFQRVPIILYPSASKALQRQIF